jgi:hypothetical protein
MAKIMKDWNIRFVVGQKGPGNYSFASSINFLREEK